MQNWNIRIVTPLELTHDEWSGLTQSAPNWYATPGYCLLYDHNPAEWVAIWQNDKNEKGIGCFWTPSGFMRNFIQLKSVGPTSASKEMLKQLMLITNAHLVIIPFSDMTLNFHRLPWWKGVLTEYESDWVVQLPQSFEEYLNMLNKTSKKHLRQYIFQFESELKTELIVLEREGITKEILIELMELHRLRMIKNNKYYSLTALKIDRRIKLAKECGLFCGRFANGKLIGGTLSYYHRDGATLSLVAHDPVFDYLHAGIVCVSDTIRHLINRGSIEYNLHTRFSPFKTRMGGIENKHFELILFSNLGIALLWYIRSLIKFRRKLFVV